jgi:hypothetical protein
MITWNATKAHKVEPDLREITAMFFEWFQWTKKDDSTSTSTSSLAEMVPPWLAVLILMGGVTDTAQH